MSSGQKSTESSIPEAVKGGPHGKNLKEGGFEGSGTDGGPLPEPGSKEDPGRAALKRVTEGKQTEGSSTIDGSSGDKGQSFGALGGDTSA